MRAAVTESSTKSKHATQLRAFDTLVRLQGGCSEHRGVELFICDYVPNHAKTGKGVPRKASGLANALGSLLAGLNKRGWRPSPAQRKHYRSLERGVLKLHADSTEVQKARPVLVRHLRRIKEYLPAMSGTKQERAKIGRLWNGYALLLLMLQGLFRKADVARIKLEHVARKSMTIDDVVIRYYVVKLQDKPRLGTVQWRHVVIVERNDDLDSFQFLRQRKQLAACGGLIGSPEHTLKLVDEIIGWTRTNVPGLHWITGHGLRVGGFQELRQVSGNDINVRLLQGGWSSHGEGRTVQAEMAAASSGYLRTNERFVQALLQVGRPAASGCTMATSC